MIDGVDLKILSMLGKQGRISNVEIAKKLTIPHSTVWQKIKRMIENGIVNFSCNVITSKFPDIIIFFAGITINENRNFILHDLVTLPNGLFTVMVTGRFDFIIVFIAKSTEMLNSTILKISDIKGVVHTESFIVLENHGLDIRSDKFNSLIKTAFAIESERIKITNKD
ncbi:MAG: Lrp/AsnC family transcriptional regulator [Promethearchaeota archaeon]